MSAPATIAINRDYFGNTRLDARSPRFERQAPESAEENKNPIGITQKTAIAAGDPVEGLNSRSDREHRLVEVIDHVRKNLMRIDISMSNTEACAVIALQVDTLTKALVSVDSARVRQVKLDRNAEIYAWLYGPERRVCNGCDGNGCWRCGYEGEVER